VAPADASGQEQLAETPDRYGAFPRLSDAQIETLARHGERQRVEPGEVLFREGDKRYDFFVVLDGKVMVVSGYGGEERMIAVHGPRRFLGELSLLTGQAAFFTAVVREPGEVLVVPVERLRALVTQDTVLGDIVLRAYLLRREMLIGLGAGFQIVGSRFSPDSRSLREFAARNRLPYRWIDLEEDEAAEALLNGLDVAPEETPVVIWRGNQVLRNPSNEELAQMIGLRARSVAEDVCDLLVVGAGPAGLAAAVYGASEGLGTVALDTVATGGQAGTSPKIENYLGFPSGISGAELANRAEIQAEKFGARISVPAEATALDERDGYYVVRFNDGSEATAKTVLITTGPLPQTRRAPVGGVRGNVCLLRRDHDGGAPVPWRPGGGRGRRQLGRAGYAVPCPAHHEGDSLDPPRRPGQRHVALPGRQDRAQPEGRGASYYGGARTGRRPGARSTRRRE
jgi:thioredoxin reductase (NADPH)